MVDLTNKPWQMLTPEPTNGIRTDYVQPWVRPRTDWIQRYMEKPFVPFERSQDYGNDYYEPMKKALTQAHLNGECTADEYHGIERAIDDAEALWDSHVPDRILRSADVSHAYPPYALYRRIQGSLKAAHHFYYMFATRDDVKQRGTYSEELGAISRSYSSYVDQLTHWADLLENLPSSPSDSSDVKEICSSILSEWKGNYPETKEEIAAHIFGSSTAVLQMDKKSLPEDVQNQLDLMKVARYKGRAREFRHRLGRELSDMASDGWYGYVHTLTVDPEHYDLVFDRGAHQGCWVKYLAATQNAIRKAMGADQSMKVRDIHRYAAVVEAGALRGRLHIHVAHMVKELPFGSEDPTCGVNSGGLRAEVRISAIEKLWPFGLSWAEPIRTSDNDVYGQLGWLWPLKDGKPKEGGTFGAVAGYMTKYLSKSLEDETWTEKYRLKQSNHLGLRAYRRMMKELSVGALLTFCQTPALIKMLTVPYSQWDKPIPNLVRKEATREWVNRMVPELTTTQIMQKLCRIPIRMNLVKRCLLMHGIKTTKIPTGLDYLNIGTMLMESTKPSASSEQYVQDYSNQFYSEVQAAVDRHFTTPEVIGKTYGTVDTLR